MARRKTKPRKPIPKSSIIVGIGWYDLAQWMKLREVAADFEQLDRTFGDWLRNAERTEREVARAGMTTRRVMVDVDSLVAWCAARQKPLDGTARAKYVQELVRGMA